MAELEKNVNAVDPFAAAAYIKTKIDFEPFFGIILGSGLGGLANEVDIVDRISYSDIPGFPKSTVEGHKGEYIFGHLDGVPVILMNGITWCQEYIPDKCIRWP